MEVLIEELELAALKPVSTPDVAEAVDKSQVGTTVIHEDLDSVPRMGESSTRYRALAARCNHVAVDTSDSQCCTNEFNMEMSFPAVASWKRLVRLGLDFSEFE